LDLQESSGKVHAEYLHNVFLSQKNVRTIKSRQHDGWYTWNRGEVRNVYIILVGKIEGKLPSLKHDLHDYTYRMLKIRERDVVDWM
jgi:hypothetical protein